VSIAPATGLPQPLTFIDALEEALEQRESDVPTFVCERSFVDYCKAANAALLQFVAAYWSDLHPALDIKRRLPFCHIEFQAIRQKYVSCLHADQEDVYALAMEELRSRGDVQIASALTSFFDYMAPHVLTASTPQSPPLPLQPPPLPPQPPPLTPSSPATASTAPQVVFSFPALAPTTPAAPTTPLHTARQSDAGPSHSTPWPDALSIPPPEVLRFLLSPFNSMANVVYDYCLASPCLRDADRLYGPDVRKAQTGPGQHWRSKEYQTPDRQASLKKECCRRKPIHDVLDSAYVGGSLNHDILTEKVTELTKMMHDHFNITQASEVMYKHMQWLRTELSKRRTSLDGRDFTARSSFAARVAAKRKLNTPPENTPPEIPSPNGS
jgi:hypothetical protein